MIRLRVDKLLEERGETRYWLVKEMESNYETVNRLVDGTHAGVKFITLEKLMKAFGCQFEELWEVTED